MLVSGLIMSGDEESETFPFNKFQGLVIFPDCILLDIFRYLDIKQLANCAQVCSQWRRVAQDRTLNQQVDLSDKSLSVREVQKFLNRYPCLKGVRDLRLRGFLLAGGHDWNKPTITPATLRLICEKMPKLVCLRIENTLFKNSNKFIRINDFPSNLLHLGLRGTRFNPSLMLGWSPGVALAQVRCLDLGQCSILSSPDLHRISHWESLRCLYLDGCYRINSGGLELLLPLLRQLTLLDIEKTDINDEGAAFVVGNAEKLVELYLGCNYITNKALYSAGKGGTLTHLEVLCLSDTGVTAEFTEVLRSALPRLKCLNLTRRHEPGDRVRKWCHHHHDHVCART